MACKYFFLSVVKRLRVIKSLAISREVIYNKRIFCKMSRSHNAGKGKKRWGRGGEEGGAWFPTILCRLF